MRAAIESIRRVVAGYAATHDTNLRAMIDEALLAALATAVVFADVVLLLVAGGAR